MILERKIPAKWDVDYSDMCPYSISLIKIWDWGYKHILPKEKFLIIKPYLNMEVPNEHQD
jgi:hypothetical protein